MSFPGHGILKVGVALLSFAPSVSQLKQVTIESYRIVELQDRSGDPESLLEGKLSTAQKHPLWVGVTRARIKYLLLLSHYMFAVLFVVTANVSLIKQVLSTYQGLNSHLFTIK